MDKTLQDAIDNLQISDVYLRHQLVDCDENFDPKFEEDISSLIIEFKHFVRQSAVLVVDDSRLLKVFIGLGVRWRRPIDDEDPEATPSGERQDDVPRDLENDQVVAMIEGELVAEYQMKKALDQECVEVFSKKNASFHVWPYWRELVQSTCAKMNFPQIVMPTVQFASNADIEHDSNSTDNQSTQAHGDV